MAAAADVLIIIFVYAGCW